MHWNVLAAGSALIASVATVKPLAQAETVVEVTARGSFDNMKQQLVLAIENRGFVVNHESKVVENAQILRQVDSLLHGIVQEAGQ